MKTRRVTPENQRRIFIRGNAPQHAGIAAQIRFACVTLVGAYEDRLGKHGLVVVTGVVRGPAHMSDGSKSVVPQFDPRRAPNDRLMATGRDKGDNRPPSSLLPKEIAKVTVEMTIDVKGLVIPPPVSDGA